MRRGVSWTDSPFVCEGLLHRLDDPLERDRRALARLAHGLGGDAVEEIEDDLAGPHQDRAGEVDALAFLAQLLGAAPRALGGFVDLSGWTSGQKHSAMKLTA